MSLRPVRRLGAVLAAVKIVPFGDGLSRVRELTPRECQAEGTPGCRRQAQAQPAPWGGVTETFAARIRRGRALDADPRGRGPIKEADIDRMPR